MLWADVTWRSCVRAEEEERWFVGRRVCIRTAGLTCARRVHLETEHIGTEAQSRSASEVAMRRTTLPWTIRTSWSRPARSCAGRTWRRIYDLALVERVFSCISRPEIPPHPVAWTSSCYHVGTSRVEFRSRTMPCEKGSRNLYYASAICHVRY